MCTRYPIINRVSELKVHIELTRFVQPEKIEIDANERAVNEKSQYCFFVCTTFDSFLNDYLILIGYGMLIPYVVIVNGPGEIPFILIRIITVTAVLLIVYYVGGIMAGDVKLLGLISGYLCGTDVIKYIILVFYFAAFIGIVKVLMNLIIDRETPKKITIKFSCPIFLAYLVLFITKGGIR